MSCSAGQSPSRSAMVQKYARGQRHRMQVQRTILDTRDVFVDLERLLDAKQRSVVRWTSRQPGPLPVTSLTATLLTFTIYLDGSATRRLESAALMTLVIV